MIIIIIMKEQLEYISMYFLLENATRHKFLNPSETRVDRLLYSQLFGKLKPMNSRPAWQSNETPS